MQLSVLGLTDIEEAVYRTLVNGGTVAEPHLGAPAEVTQALAGLCAKGLIRPAPGEPGRYVAQPPDLTLTPLLLAAEVDLARARAAANALVAAFRPAASGAQLSRQAVEVITSSDEVRRRAFDIQRRAQRELRVFDRPPYKHNPLDNPAERELLAAGVTCRVVYEQSALAVPGRLAHLEAMAQLAERARIVPSLPIKLIVCDDRSAFIPLAGATDLEQAIVASPSPLLDALIALFEATWRRAVPLRLAVVGGPANLDPDQRRLLALLSTGVDDDEIGLRLGLSTRTLHRRIGALMARLGVSTRFQLGTMAARGRHR